MGSSHNRALYKCPVTLTLILFGVADERVVRGDGTENLHGLRADDPGRLACDRH